MAPLYNLLRCTARSSNSWHRREGVAKLRAIELGTTNAWRTFSCCTVQFARCSLLSCPEAHPTRMRADKPITISTMRGFELGSANMYSDVRRNLRSCSPIAFLSCFCFRFCRRCIVGQSASVRRSSVKTLAVLSPKKRAQPSEKIRCWSALKKKQARYR